MKQLIRIPFGVILCPFPLLAGSWIWLWESNECKWVDTVGKATWHLMSGQWDKLPD